MVEAVASAVETNQDARWWGMLAHVLALSAFITGVGVILGPLIAWLVKKNEHPFVDDQGKESLNFQITCLLAAIVAYLLVFVLVGFVLLPVVFLYWLVFMIVAAVKANDGIRYRYPIVLRLLR